MGGVLGFNLESILPALFTFGIFALVVSALLKALLRPAGKMAILAVVLVALGIVSVDTVQHLFVGAVVLLFKTVQLAFAAVMSGGGQHT